MTFGNGQERKKFGQGEILQEARQPMAKSLSACLEDLKTSLEKRNALAAIWQEWEELLGEPLASHSTPISVRGKILVIGASHPQWLQALQYNRMQLLSKLKAAGKDIRGIRIQRHHQQSKGIKADNEYSIWEKHPSRVDVHGLIDCQLCGSPSPSGEIKLWNKCGFCKRKEFESKSK